MQGDPRHYHVWAIQRGLYVAASAIEKDGSFVIPGVPPGTWRVVLQKGVVEIAVVEEADTGGAPVVLRIEADGR